MEENNSSVLNIDKQSDTQLNQTVPIGLDRFAMFNMFVKDAIDKISSGVSEEDYVNLFGKLSALRKSKSAPGKMQKRMKTNLMSSLVAEVEAMAEEEQLQEKLQKLDKLVEDSTLEEGKEAWRPNGNVNDHLRSYAMAVKLKRKSSLEECLREREQATETLRQQVGRFRGQVRSMKMKLQNLHDQSLDNSVINSVDAMIKDKEKKFK
uniref:Uncharacterized protein n=1 Tax=Graphocephala atropunctata TaxID=36148 RepID=A0A1B6L512_9HEMI